MNIRLKCALVLNFFIAAILMNSVGIVILQAVNYYGATETQASWLEAFKDLTVAASSFLVASFIPRLGYKNSMAFAVALLFIGCIAMPLINTFWMTKVLFMMTGLSFMLIKVTTYSVISLYTKSDSEYSSFINIIEGLFMVGVLCGSLLFSFFMHLGGDTQVGWLETYWVLAALSAFSLILILSSKIDEAHIKHREKSPLEDVNVMFSLLKRHLIWVFVACIFIYVLVEQAIGTWLPIFYNHEFALTESASVLLAGILFASTALGRLVWGFAMRYIDWMTVLVGVLLAAVGLTTLVTLIMTYNPHFLTIVALDVPLVALLLPMLGFFIGPVYPTVCASLLSSLHHHEQSAMMGWIIVFSARSSRRARTTRTAVGRATNTRCGCATGWAPSIR